MEEMSPRTAASAVLAERHASRKIVTALFVDLVGSTRLADTLDVEAYRALMDRYFAEASAVITRHGGFLEKFIGDAVMAVFGVPDLHEDDALRAVTAAVQVRTRLAELDAEFLRNWGTTVAVRAGVESGEAIVSGQGADGLQVSGPALSTAARLEQMAAPGEVVVGQAAFPLVRAAVLAEPLGGLELRGKRREVAAWAIREVVPGAAGWTRRLDSPLIDRTDELAALLGAFRSAGSGGCRLASVLGPAGVGKSRLGQELVARLGDGARVLRGRCLSYGDGITFWPVVEVLRDAAGVLPTDSGAIGLEKLGRLLPAGQERELVLARLAGLLGATDVQPAVQEIFWAVRTLLERLAAERPVVLLLDDVQWAETTLLDLVEYLADRMREAPVLVVCLARPELLELRPGWGTARPDATVVQLDALRPEDTRRLVEHLVDGPVAPDVTARIGAASEGNPLFVEEILRNLVDTGELASVEGRWRFTGDASRLSIPATVQALVSARLDRLDPDEAMVLERAAVVGREFGWDEVATLIDDEHLAGRVAAVLQSLLHKQLVRPLIGEAGDEDAFEFAHTAVRDTAYQQIPKADRVRLHERFGEWLAMAYGRRAGEYEEVVGHHMEAAYTTLCQLGPASPRSADLAARAAAPLTVAGRRAFGRGDMPAAVRLLSRAAQLRAPDDTERLRILPELAFALMETGDFGRLQEVVAELDRGRDREPGLAGHAAVLRLWMRLFTDPVGWTEVAEEETSRAETAFRSAGDERGLARVSSLLGVVDLLLCRYGAAERHWTQASEHARSAGDHRDELDSLAWVPLAVWAGATPTGPGLSRCREIRARVDGDKKAMASAYMAEAAFLAGAGRPGEARAALRRAEDLLRELALVVWLAGPYAQLAGWVGLLSGDPAAAEAALRPAFEDLQRMGEMSWFSTTAGLLAEAVLESGRLEEAAAIADVARDAAAPHDVYSQVVWRTAAARGAASAGRLQDAVRLADEAVDLVTPTDFLHLQWHTSLAAARVLADAGRPAEARLAAERAMAAASAKDCPVGVTAAREVADALSP